MVGIRAGQRTRESAPSAAVRTDGAQIPIRSRLPNQSHCRPRSTESQARRLHVRQAGPSRARLARRAGDWAPYPWPA